MAKFVHKNERLILSEQKERKDEVKVKKVEVC